MCYNISYLTKKKLDYAKRIGELGDVDDLEKILNDLYKKAGTAYYSSAFDHPDVPIITNTDPHKIQLFSWGLIPYWVKDSKQAVDISNKTINARGEEMFEKPSFRYSAKKKRCVVLADGFFEFHWKGSKSFPFFIQLKSNEPMFMAGLWETWNHEKEGLIRNTFSIVTTRANPLLEYIHNKPKASEGPRMPVILSVPSAGEWLKTGSESSEEMNRIKRLIIPYDETLMKAYTVPHFKGKDGVGNSIKAIEKVEYPELNKKRSGK